VGLRAGAARRATLYLLGGRTHCGYSTEAYCVDLPRGTVTCPAPAPGGQLPRGRLGAAAVALPDGRLLLAGGGDDRADTRDAFTFDPATHAWRRVAAAPGVDAVLRQSLVLVTAPDDAASAGGATALVGWGGSEYADPVAAAQGAMTYSPNARVLLLEPAA
jgi:hypothetical protein